MKRFSAEAFERFRDRSHEGFDQRPSALGLAGDVRSGRTVLLGLSCDRSRIVSARFQTFNCVAAVAAADWVCEAAEGQTGQTALRLEVVDLVEALGDFPEHRRFCAEIALSALQIAVHEARRKGVLE